MLRFKCIFQVHSYFGDDATVRPTYQAFLLIVFHPRDSMGSPLAPPFKHITTLEFLLFWFTLLESCRQTCSQYVGAWKSCLPEHVGTGCQSRLSCPLNLSHFYCIITVSILANMIAFLYVFVFNNSVQLNTP